MSSAPPAALAAPGAGYMVQLDALRAIGLAFVIM
jgi:hypothetical protein